LKEKKRKKSRLFSSAHDHDPAEPNKALPQLAPEPEVQVLELKISSNFSSPSQYSFGPQLE
jgi:hypothetical protein